MCFTGGVYISTVCIRHVSGNMKKHTTSWGNVADWYDKHLADANTFHAQVVAPNLTRIVNLQPHESLLELGCGQGFFLEQFSAYSKKLTGVDVAKELILRAVTRGVEAEYVVASAEDATILSGKTFDVITIVLALQNMRNLDAVVANLSRLLAPGGRVCIVLNHPTFRIPKHSSWGTDTEQKIQYRRIDSYLREQEHDIDMTPGTKETHKKSLTKSYHRPLQVYMKAFAKESFVITALEEWISHRKSEPGPWAKAEDIARKEIPLFMCLVLKKL